MPSLFSMRIAAHSARQANARALADSLGQHRRRAERRLPFRDLPEARHGRVHRSENEGRAVPDAARARLPDQPQVCAERLQVQHGDRGGLVVHGRVRTERVLYCKVFQPRERSVGRALQRSALAVRACMCRDNSRLCKRQACASTGFRRIMFGARVRRRSTRDAPRPMRVLAR
jgi:hypothetical protein